MSSFSKKYFEDMRVEKRLDNSRKGYKNVYIYAGDFYKYDLDKKGRLVYKLIIFLLTAVAFALFVVSGLQPVPSNYSTAVAIPLVITIFPLCYEIFGMVQFIFSKEKMMRVDFEDISKKLKIGAAASGIMSAVTAIVSLIMTLVSNTAGSYSVLVILGYFLSAVCSLTIFIMYKNLKHTITPNENKQ